MNNFEFVCPACDKLIEETDILCLHCGYLLDEDERGERVKKAAASSLLAPAPETEEETEEDYSGRCPNCDEPLYIEEGYCPACEQTLCTRCGGAVDEDDEICSHCQVALFFECPLCQFELTAGSSICAGCHALFPSHCAYCATHLEMEATECPTCQREIVIQVRQNARVLHNVVSGVGLVRIVACPECGQQHAPYEGDCPECGQRVCAHCLIILEQDEICCPGCGTKAIGVVKPIACPQCAKPIEKGVDACSYCDQLLCPQCLAMVSEEDVVCPQCAIEFELACSECGATVPAAATQCPQCHLAF